jgi:hypothetical protein
MRLLASLAALAVSGRPDEQLPIVLGQRRIFIVPTRPACSSPSFSR